MFVLRRGKDSPQPSFIPAGLLRREATASGGIPFSHFDITAGSLPDGLSLDPFRDERRNTPRRPGVYEFTVRVRKSRRDERRREPEATHPGHGPLMVLHAH